MEKLFQNRSIKILNTLIGYELDKAKYDYICSQKRGEQPKKAFERISMLEQTLFNFGEIGKKLAVENSITDENNWKDQFSGGRADEQAPADFKKTDLEKGQKIETEHTDNYDLALEIAMDHLSEFPTYYEELDKMEKKLKDKEADDENMGSQTVGDNPLMSPTNDELPPTDKSLNAPSRRPGPYA